MPSCVFIQCTNRSKHKNKTKGITFHTFPQNELHRYNWTQIVRQQRRQEHWLPSKHSKLCSEHFKPSDLYVTNKGLIRILREAVPHFQDAMNSSGLDSPESIQNENTDDTASIIETPREKILKLKMRKLLSVKQKLLGDNNNLKNRYKTLQEKCIKLRATISTLKTVIGEEQFKELLLRKKQKINTQEC